MAVDPLRDALTALAKKIISVRTGTIASDNVDNSQVQVILDGPGELAVSATLVNGGPYPKGTRVSCLAYPTKGLMVVGPLVSSTLQAEVDAIEATLATAFPGGIAGWTGYTPDLLQPGAISKTVNQARWTQIGRQVTAQMSLSVTGSGTAGNVILFGLPTPSAGFSQGAIGSADMFDSSTGIFYAGTAVLHDANYAKFIISNNGNYAGISGFSAALASGDFLSMQVVYEAGP